jgi:hypothetical protein
MAHPLLNGLRVRVFSDEETGVRVPKIVKPKG